MVSLRFILVKIAILWLIACSSLVERSAREAEGYGFRIVALSGLDFEHRVYRNHHLVGSQGATLHVYLEGDGSPWLRTGVIARDPTARAPMMLKLMATDSTPSLYLGRPCYHGYFSSPPCHPDLWTGARYSEVVVASMAEVLGQIIVAENIQSLVFFGFSGGGALAVLLAERFVETLAVVTIAGNLDTVAWAEMHNYTMLEGSLNPASRIVLEPGISQLHIIGRLDTNIKASFVDAFASKQSNSELVVIDGFDHSCCWEAIWAEVLVWSRVVENSQGRSKDSFRLKH